MEAVEPGTQDTQLSLPARKDLPWLSLPLRNEGKCTPLPGVQISKWRPTDLPVPRDVLRESQKKHGLSHIYWVPNNMEEDWHADGEYIFCQKVATTEEGAQKLCECAEAFGGVQVESSEKPQKKEGKRGKGRRKLRVKPLAATGNVEEDRDQQKDKDPDKDAEKDTSEAAQTAK